MNRLAYDVFGPWTRCRREAPSLAPERLSARVVDIGGAIGVVGYGALAYYSRGQPRRTDARRVLRDARLGCHPVDRRIRRPRSRRLRRPRRPASVLGHRVPRSAGLFGFPLFEDDYFRYLWDGYRFAEVGTPYGWAPAASFADAEVPQVFQRILDQVNYPDIPTIYGPVAEFSFLLAYLVAPGSLVPLQLILIGVDILLIRLLLTAAPPRFVLLYAWCPLVIKEIAFTAHPDGLGRVPAGCRSPAAIPPPIDGRRPMPRPCGRCQGVRFAPGAVCAGSHGLPRLADCSAVCWRSCICRSWSRAAPT